MRRFPRPTWLRFLVPLVMVFIVMQVRLYFERRQTAGMDGPPFTMMFVAVMVSCWFGGVGPGLLATFAGAAVCDYMFIEPKGTLLGNSFGYDIRLGLFIVEGLFVCWVVQALRRSSATSRQMERNLRLIAQNTSDVIFAYDMARQLMYVNQAFESLTGNTINELSENGLMNYIHLDDSPRMRSLFDQLFAGKSFKDVEYRIITHEGEVKWCRATWGPLLDEFGHQIGVQGRETDITEQKRSEATLRFLSETSALLSKCVNLDQTLNQIAQVSVRHFADWCMIDLMESGTPRTVAAAHADSAREPWIVELQRDYPPHLGDVDGRGKVLASGQPQIVSVVTAATIAAMSRDARQLKLLHNLAPRSLLCVPLKSRERVLGAITLVSAETQRHYNADDLIFAADLASRIAQTVQATLAATAQSA